MEFLERFDHYLLLLINGWHSPIADKFMLAISGTFIWIPFYLFLLVLVIYKEKKRAWLVLLFIGLLIFFSDQLSVQAFKNVFQRYRPCHNLELQNQLHLLNGVCRGLYGFVSSHAANTFSIATFLVLFFKKRISYWLLIWAAMVSYSRIYLGVHYPSDVAGGALLGITLGSILFFLFSRTRRLI